MTFQDTSASHYPIGIHRVAASTKGRETYHYFPQVTDHLELRNKYWDHYTTQFVSGLGNFKAKLRGLWLGKDPSCAHCGIHVSETAWHVLAEFPNYELMAIWGNCSKHLRR